MSTSRDEARQALAGRHYKALIASKLKGITVSPSTDDIEGPRYQDTAEPPVSWTGPATLVIHVKRAQMACNTVITPLGQVCLTVTPSDLVVTGTLRDELVCYTVSRDELGSATDQDRLYVEIGDDLSSSLRLKSSAAQLGSFRIGDFWSVTAEETAQDLAMRAARALMAEHELMALVTLLTHGVTRIKSLILADPDMTTRDLSPVLTAFENARRTICQDPRLADRAHTRGLVLCQTANPTV